MSNECICGHDAMEHGQERALFSDTDSRRELCMVCPGYVDEDELPNYPHGQAWHRFKEARLSEPRSPQKEER